MKLDFFNPALGPVIKQSVYSFQLDLLDSLDAAAHNLPSIIPKDYGVYFIISKSHKCVYVGSTAGQRGFLGRIRRHYISLRNGKHHCRKMQAHYNEYGPSNFLCYLIEICEKEKCIEREQHYLDTLKPFGDFGYNTFLKADSSLGVKLTTAHKLKISERMKRQWKYDPEFIKKQLARIASKK